MKKTLIIITLAFCIIHCKAQVNSVKSDTIHPLTKKISGGADNIDAPVDNANQKIAPKQVYSAVEVEPRYPGGFTEFLAYIKTNQKTPQDAIDKPAKVFAQFIVEKDGSLSGIKILRSTSDMDSAEALRLLKQCPKWNPAIQNGKAVRCYYTLPVMLGSKEEE